MKRIILGSIGAAAALLSVLTPISASAAPIPTTTAPTTACTGMTSEQQIGREDDSSEGVTVSYGDDHTFAGYTGPANSYYLQHQAYTENNGTGRRILNAKAILSNAGGHFGIGGARIYFAWDNATRQFVGDSTLPGFDTSITGQDTSTPGVSIYALQAGGASPLSYESVQQNGVVADTLQPPGIPAEPALVPTDSMPTYSLGDIAQGSSATADFMLAIELTTAGTQPTWGFNLHFSGQFQCPAISNTYSSALRLGSPYSSSVSTTAEGAVTYSLARGTLPAGLALDSHTGTISGTPTTAGSSAFTIDATDAWGEYTTLDVRLTVPSAQNGLQLPTLAFTGADAEPGLLVGAGLIVGGGAAIAIAAGVRKSRRRKGRHKAQTTA
jgi:hypothetical protein